MCWRFLWQCALLAGISRLSSADRFAFEQRPASDIAQLYLVASYVLRGEKGALAKQRQDYQKEPSNPAGLVTWIKEQRALAAKHDANNDI